MGADAGIGQHRQGEAGIHCEISERHRQHARYIRVGLRERHAGLSLAMP